jgi:hypothetical protein
MWGRACYFAQNASYSANGYSFHDRTTGNYKFFQAEVVVGDYVTLPQNGELRKPPPKVDNP